MAVQKIPIEQFLFLSAEHPVLDVRSPSEFLHAHIPNACSLPLFDDEERKVVGTAYKQQGSQQAIKIGLDYFGIKMRKMVEKVESLFIGRWSLDVRAVSVNDHRPTNIVLIHCWRGGMRSAAVAWLLDLYGYKVYTLAGGYKAFRNWALQQFDKAYYFKILGGYTGSGKTILLEQLQRTGEPVINLEALANHKGSAFGELGEEPQPSQEMFENLLALDLFCKQGLERTLWLEDESRRIGKVNIPDSIWKKMRSSPIWFIDIPFEQRLDYLVRMYGVFNKEDLINSISRIQKRLGGLETKNAVSFLSENKIKESFSILLKYYDKCYTKALYNRTSIDGILNKIPCENVSINNIEQLNLVPNKV